MWQTIELRELELFLVLCEELHFSRTAERLGLSQSRVSQVVRTLEAKVGGPLLVRTSRRVALTELGLTFRDEVAPRVEALRGGLEAVSRRATEVDGELRITLTSPITQGPCFTAIVRAFRRAAPGCTVTVRDGTDEDAVRLLLEGEADVVASWLPVTGTDVEVGPELLNEERVLAVGRDHPLAGRSMATLDDVADHGVCAITFGSPDLVNAILPHETAAGRPIPRRPIPAKTIQELLALVALGEVVHPTVPSLQRHYAHPDVVYLPLPELPRLRSALLVRRRQTPQAARRFLAVARDVLAT